MDSLVPTTLQDLSPEKDAESAMGKETGATHAVDPQARNATRGIFLIFQPNLIWDFTRLQVSHTRSIQKQVFLQ